MYTCGVTHDLSKDYNMMLDKTIIDCFEEVLEFHLGQRVSCVLVHDGAATVCHGVVTRGNTGEHRIPNCEVRFDDGRSHRVVNAELTPMGWAGNESDGEDDDEAQG